jgi:hypothetical protein
MPIKQIFEKKEDVPEFLRASVLEQDGKFVFEAELPGETVGLKKALEAERLAKANAEKALKGFEGIDPEKARQMIADAEKAAVDKLKQKGDWEAMEKQLRDQLAVDLQKREEQFQGELSKIQERNKALESSLYEQLITAQLSAEIAKHTTSVGPLLLGMASHLKVFEEEGKFVAKVVDAQGNPRIADLKGSPFTIAGLVEEFKTKPEWQPLFPASKNGGTGAPGNSTAGPGGVRTIRQGDYESISANLEGIAKGEITVTQ